MNDNPIVLGINSVYHESAACLAQGNRILAFAEEERFNRRKHAKPADIDTVDQIPESSIEECLIRAGITAEDVDHVAISFDPSLRRPPIDEPATERSWGTPVGEQELQERLARIPDAVSKLLGRDISANWAWVPHEVAHAASAYYCSPFEDAAVLSMDGIGEDSTSLLAHGTGTVLKPLSHTSYPDSLGFVWEKLSKFTGMDEYSAPKLMALAAFASPDAYREQFRRLVSRDDDGFHVDLDALRFRSEDYAPLERLFGKARKGGDPLDYRYAQVAASLQELTEEIIFGFACHLKEITGSANLCLAGGVALNCVAMGRLLNEGPFDGVFVQPLAHDGGTALGAALWVSNTHGNDTSRFVMRDPYIGSACFSDADIDAALAAAGVTGHVLESPARTGASLVAQGKIVGWFQGAAEVGPRALGNRSIVADPRDCGTKDLINIKVKHREYFRPFAPAVLAEEAADWFEFRQPSLSTDFMSFAVPVRPSKRAVVPAIVHVDGSARMQTVHRDINPLYHELISEFRALTGVPLVINTSFNTFDEPIVYRPEDAIRTYLRTGMDALIIGSRLVQR